jgi:hypothetical protein
MEKEGAEVTWELTSSAFKDGEAMPRKYTGDGADVSPPLNWTTPPTGALELALIVDDPDAPSGDWVHWVIYGLPPSLPLLPEAVPAREIVDSLGGAKQGRNDFKQIGYRGPSPPPGKVHHYHFKLYALNAKLDLSPGATKRELLRAMEGHILGRAELVGTYSR